MKKIYNKDIILVISLAVISLLFLISPPLNMFPLRIIPCVLLLFILPGCSILAALYPFKERFTLKKYLSISVIISIAVTSILSMISVYTAFKIPYTLFVAILTAITVLMAIISYKRRGNLDKLKSGRYLVCEKCNGYYKLREGESLESFKHCTCGGDLKYADSAYFEPQKVKKEPGNIDKTMKKMQLKSISTEYRDVSLVIFITFLSIIFVINPIMDSSIVRAILMFLLAFFLSGYSLSVNIFPLNKNIPKTKRIFYSIIFSLLIILALSFFSLKTDPTVCIMALSIITVSFIMISFINRLRSPERIEDEAPGNDSKLLNEYYPKKHKYEVFKDNEKFRGFDFKKYSGESLQTDLLLVLLATILCVIFVTIPQLNDTPVRIVLGLIFILFLPGYSLIAALFPKKDDLDGIERLALSFGLSIAVTPLIGLLLNYTPFGIRLTPILISLSIFTVAMSIIAYIRRLRMDEDKRFKVEFKNHLNNIAGKFENESGTDRILSILLVISILLAISMTIYVIVTPKQGEKFTEFYILGPNGKASDYPTNLTMGQTGTVNIGIVNHEYADVNYKLLVKLNNQTVKEENITLSSNGKWENKYIFTATRAGEKQKLEFLLFKLPDDKKSYRSLHLWINVM